MPAPALSSPVCDHGAMVRRDDDGGRLRIKRKGRPLRPGETRRWTPPYFYGLGLHKLSGTVAYPEAA